MRGRMETRLSGNSLSDRLDSHPPAHAPQTAGWDNTPTRPPSLPTHPKRNTIPLWRKGGVVARHALLSLIVYYGAM